MQGSFHRFYVHEDLQCHGRPVWEWFLAQANKRGIRGGSALKAIAGFGRHHVWHASTRGLGPDVGFRIRFPVWPGHCLPLHRDCGTYPLNRRHESGTLN
jgi:Uncharacterized ACR, COG1993